MQRHVIILLDTIGTKYTTCEKKREKQEKTLTHKTHKKIQLIIGKTAVPSPARGMWQTLEKKELKKHHHSPRHINRLKRPKTRESNRKPLAHHRRRQSPPPSCVWHATPPGGSYGKFIEI